FRHPDTGTHSMNPISRTGLFLAITALLAPAAAGAQDAGPTAPTPAQSPAPPATALDAVSVTGRYIPAPMLSSAQVLSHISREDIEREGASTAAEALNRVPGLSVSQGKYDFVRGLNQRYSQALLDGTPLPSPEPLKRLVPPDLFPTNVPDTIEVQKTYSARYPAQFGAAQARGAAGPVPGQRAGRDRGPEHRLRPVPRRIRRRGAQHPQLGGPRRAVPGTVGRQRRKPRAHRRARTDLLRRRRLGVL